MLPNLASGPQNQPMANVAVSVLLSWILSFPYRAAAVMESFLAVSMVFLSLHFTMAELTDRAKLGSQQKSTSTVQTVRTGDMEGGVLSKFSQ